MAKKKKPKVAAAIKDAGAGLADLMRDHLTHVGNDLVRQVMVNWRGLTPANKLDAIKGLTPKGVNDYKAALKQALSITALDAIDKARKEVPKAKHVRLTESEDSIKLDEFDRLPPRIQKKIQSMMTLLTGKQIGDLQKVIEFAYAQAEEETDNEDEIESQINDSAIGWLDSNSLVAGAELNAATIINSARSAYFFDDDVAEEIEAFEFVNGDPVTEICQDLAGTVFSKDDPGADEWQPPLHWNCKSYIVPILVGDLGDREIEKLSPSTKKIAEQKQFSEPHDCDTHR